MKFLIEIIYKSLSHPLIHKGEIEQEYCLSLFGQEETLDVELARLFSLRVLIKKSLGKVE